MRERKLHRRYLLLTTCVGFIGVAVGLSLLFLAFGLLLAELGMSISQPAPFDSTAVRMIAMFMLAIPIFIYLGCATTAGAVGIFLVWTGRMTRNEAAWYAFCSRYPASWYHDARRLN